MGLISDAKRIAERDPAARNAVEVILLYQGFHALVFYRCSHLLYRARLRFLARLVSQAGRFVTGIEIHPGAKIGKGLFIDHGTGVVVGETAEIGDDCTLYHGATLGGTGNHTGKRHPTIGNNVLISAGAKVLGPITIGDNSRVGANSVVLKDIPAYATAVGIPARVVKHHGRRVFNPAGELLQTDLPDPACRALEDFSRRLAALEARMNHEDMGMKEEETA